MMMFYFIVLWSLVVLSCPVYAERQDFKLEGYETESLQWKNPHSDVFGFSDELVIDELSELSGTARDAIQSDKLHAAVKACHSHVQTLSQQVRNNDVYVQRFVKYLVRIYDESMVYHEGVILMKLTPEDMKVVKSFADGGKFVSHSHNNIHDLLRGAFRIPPTSILDRISPMTNIFSKIWDFTLYVFQEIRFMLMQIVFSADVVIYATMILPPLSFLYSLRKGHPVVPALLYAGGAVALIAYFVELRSAIETARAKDMARLLRAKNIPPECMGKTLGYYDWAVSIFRSTFALEDRCVQYFREQVPESPIEPSQIFWKIVFTPLTVAMDKFGYGLSRFISSFGGDMGWFTKLVFIPVGIIALLFFLALLFSFVRGGSVDLPVLGKVRFWHPSGLQAGPTSTDQSVQPPSNSSPQPTISNNYNFHFFNSSQPTPAEITCPPGINMSITVPSGPTLQLVSPPTADTPSGPAGQVVPQITDNGPGNKNDSFGVSGHGQHKVITTQPGPRRSTSTISAGSSREQSNFSVADTNNARHSRLFSEFSDTDYNSSTYVSSHCALREIGGGDFLPRDFSHRMLPSGVIRWRSHHRKLSL